jgi:hypothetical protein
MEAWSELGMRRAKRCEHATIELDLVDAADAGDPQRASGVRRRRAAAGARYNLADCGGAPSLERGARLVELVG